MQRNRSATQSGQGLVEYALLLTLVSVVAILSIQIFGVALQREYCKVLNALGTTETFCPTENNGDPGDEGESGDLTGDDDIGEPGNGGSGEGSGPGDSGAGDPGNGGEEGNGDDGDDGNPGQGSDPGDDNENNQPPQEPVPGVITLYQVQAKNNKNHKEVWFTAQFNGGYVANVVLTAYLDGESKVMMRENGNKYRADWQEIHFPVELRITAHDYEGRYLDAELRYTIQGNENGRVDG